MPKLFELQRDRHDESTSARAVVQKAIEEKRDLTDAEKADVETRQARIKDLSRRIELLELSDSFESTPVEERSARGLGPDLPNLDGKHKYSLLRALTLTLPENRGRLDGLEGEVHLELQRHRRSTANGILVPLSLSNRSLVPGGDVERRDGVSTSAAAGAIASVLGSELIEILRNKTVMRAMGARILSGLTGGTFSLPKQTSKATAYHTAEAASAAVSNLSVGQVTWTPRTLTAVSALTRKTLLQSSLDVEAMVRQDLMAVLATEFDRVGINGAGADNVPLGVLQDPSVPTVAIDVNGGAPNWAAVVALETAVSAANADFGSLGYLTSSKGRGKMKVTPKIGSTFPVFLWEKGAAYGEGEVNGYHAMATEQVPSNLTKGSTSGGCTALIYGNFESATYGTWSGVDMLADPYTRGAAGSLLIYMYQDYDFQFRYANAFAKCVDMTY